MKKQISFKSNSIFTLIVIVLFPFVVIGVAFSVYTYRVDKENIIVQHKLITAFASKIISNYLYYEEKGLPYFLRVNNSLEMIPTKLSEISFFPHPGDQDPELSPYRDIILLDNRGNILYSYLSGGVRRGSRLSELARTNEFLVPLYTEKVYYSPIHFDKTTVVPFMRISVPVIDYQSGVVQGVLILDKNLMFMREVISDINMGSEGVVYLVKSDGRILAHPDPSLINRNASIDFSKGFTGYKNIQGRRSFFGVKKIPIGGLGQYFFLVVENPVDEVYSHTYKTLFIIGIMAIFTFGGIVVFRLINLRQFALPLESLAVTAKKIGVDDLLKKEKAGKFNDPNKLAESYNIIASRLTKTINALESERILLKNAINALSHPFYIIDVKDYTVKIANKASKSGILSAESKCYYLLHRYDRPCHEKQLLCPIKEIKRTGKSVILRHEHGDTAKNIYEIHGYPVFDKEGEVVQIIEYSIEITEKESLLLQSKVKDEQLIRADKLASLGTFAAGMAHEINNPNQAILNCGLFLRESWGSIRAILDNYSEERGGFSIGGIEYSDFRNLAGKCFKGIPDNSRRINNIVSQLKRFSIPNQENEYKEIDISKVIVSSVELITCIIDKSKLNVDMDFAPNLPVFKGNQSKLEQVFVNILQNSYQARRNDKINILISTSWCENEQRIIIEIKDDGKGISQDNIIQLTDSFFTTKLEEGGSGLGLTVSESILKDYDGFLEFDSVEGEGTTVRVILPIKSI